jgi:hypothetical protein
MYVRIYLDLHTSRTQVELTIQLIWFADFTHNSMANYLHTISRICCSRRYRHNTSHVYKVNPSRGGCCFISSGWAFSCTASPTQPLFSSSFILPPSPTYRQACTQLLLTPLPAQLFLPPSSPLIKALLPSSPSLFPPLPPPNPYSHPALPPT